MQLYSRAVGAYTEERRKALKAHLKKFLIRCLFASFIAASAISCSYSSACDSADFTCQPALTFLFTRLRCAIRGSCQMFLSSPFPGGATFIGISGADSVCNNEPARPILIATYKAFIVSSTVRRASVTAGVGDGQIDWVLQPSTVYTRADGTLIAQTNSNSIFTFPLAASFSPSPGVIWTGLAGNWTNGAADCSGWTGTATTALIGNANVTSNASISAAGNNCNTAGYMLLCVEQ
jgi:hypothetical protein